MYILCPRSILRKIGGCAIGVPLPVVESREVGNEQ